MGSKRMITLAFALVCALIAAFMAKNVLGKKPEEKLVEINKVETVDVLIAAKDVRFC